MTVLDLLPNPQGTSAFDPENILQVWIDTNVSHAPVPPTVVKPPPFFPSGCAIWVNALWFLSLVLSIDCALLVTLMQQWAQRYIRVTQQPGYSPHRRARVLAFFFEGVGKVHVPWVSEMLRSTFHLSACPFFAGLLVLLFNIVHTVFRALVWFLVLTLMAYIWVMVLPIFRPNSPYYTPLSSTIWFLYTGVPYAVFKALSSVFCDSRCFDGLKRYYYNRLFDGVGKMVERIALQLPSEIDFRVLQSTFDALGEDGSRSRFFAAIPGFLKHVGVPQEPRPDEFRTKFRTGLDRFLDRTFSSDSISESVRSDRLIICLSATHAALGPDGVTQTLQDILNGRWRRMLQSIEVAQSLGRWGNSTNCDSQFTHYVRRIVTQVVVGARGRDYRWISLTRDEFGVPDRVLRDNIAHGDSALLSLLIHVTRQAFRSGFWTPSILGTLTQFDMCNTIPELQHEFCALWNEIVREAWRGGANCTAVNILREIHHAYIGLHQGTDAFSAHTFYYNPVLAQPQSYRTCNIPSHRSD